MKIATYNINGVNGHLAVLLRWLKETSPDVACLQELKAPQEKFPEAALAEAGYSAVWNGQKSWNGVAILSKNYALNERHRVLPGDDDDLQSRFLEVEVNGLILVCIYLPNGNPAPGPKFEYKLGWFERLRHHTSSLVTLKTPVIITGDFNVMPHDIDVYKPERWVEDALFRPETREQFQLLINQGWTDGVRMLYPTETIYTFWDYFRNAYGRNAGLRIDHFLINPPFEKKLVSAGVDKQVRGWEKSSDHAPVWIEFKM